MGSRPRARPGHPYLAGAPMLVAHRGGAKLAPENTMAAFRQAVDGYEADMLELDVHLTADDEVVVIHDPTVDRTTDGSGPVASLRWDEIREMDAGHHFKDLKGEPTYRGRGVAVPRLAELLDELPSVRLNVECKCAAVAGPLVEVIRSRGAEHRVLVAAGHEPDRRGAQGYGGPWGASSQQIRRFHVLHRWWIGRFYTPEVDAFQIPEAWGGRQILTEAFLRESHRRNIPVHIWTVDEADDMRRLLHFGVDAIQTDRPDLLARVLHEETGRPLPPALEDNAGAGAGA